MTKKSQPQLKTKDPSKKKKAKLEIRTQDDNPSLKITLVDTKIDRLETKLETMISNIDKLLFSIEELKAQNRVALVGYKQVHQRLEQEKNVTNQRFKSIEESLT